MRKAKSLPVHSLTSRKLAYKDSYMLETVFTRRCDCSWAARIEAVEIRPGLVVLESVVRCVLCGREPPEVSIPLRLAS